MSNSNPTGWSHRPDLAALGAYADAMGAVLESIAAVLPLHLDGAELDLVTREKFRAWAKKSA